MVKIDLWETDRTYEIIAGGDKTLILELKPAIVQAMETLAMTTTKAGTTIKTLEEALKRIEWTDIQSTL